MNDCGIKLTRLYLFALSLVAVAVIGGQVLLQASLASCQADAKRINLAGRQRMLSVELVKLAYQRSHDSLSDAEIHSLDELIRQTAESIRKTQFGLIHGDPVLGLAATDEPSELQFFHVVADPLESMIAAADQFLDATGSPRPGAPALGRLSSSQAAFLPQMNDLVFRMSHNANRRLLRAKNLEYGILALTLVVLILEALFVFRPAVAEIRRTIELLRQREASLVQSEQRHRDLFKYSAGAIICLDPDSGRISDVNPAGAAQLSRSPEVLIGKRFASFLDEASSELFGDQLCRLGKEESTQCRLTLLVEGLGRRTWLVRLTYYRRDDGDASILMTAHDITDQVQRERELIESNQRDGLTGLLNRGEFDRRIAEISQLHESRGIPFTLGLIDIDRFKRINDRFGHQGGDAVLRTVAGIVQSACRSADVVARYGGEEIAVLFPSLGLKDAEPIAERIRKTLEQSEIVVGVEGTSSTVRATVSIGLAGAPAHANRGDELVRLADAALYSAKEGGRNAVVIADLRIAEPCEPGAVGAAGLPLAVTAALLPGSAMAGLSTGGD